MFTEVELKFQVKDFVQVRENLLLAGALQVSEAGHEENTVYDLADGSLASSGCLLRVRAFGGEVFLTVKEPGIPGNMKIRREHESTLSISMKAADEMLSALGYSPVYHYSKIREIWAMGGHVHICLDTLHFGKFVEIEADTTLKVSETAICLGFLPEEGLNRSYRQLEAATASSMISCP
jgi:predicted adenylyl cyclase CyaB